MIMTRLIETAKVIIIYNAIQLHLKKTQHLEKIKIINQSKVGRREDELTSETPDFDGTVIAPRNDFILTQPDAANSSFVPNQGTIAAFLVPGPHLQ